MLKHPIIRGMLGTTAFIVAAEWFVWLTSAAWAIVIPMGAYRIDLGDLPQWVIALVAAIGMWKSWKAEKHAMDAASAAVIAVAKIEEVRHETNSMRAALELAKLAEGRKQVHDEIAEAASTVKDAKDNARAEIVADAEAAAKISAAANKSDK